MSGKQPQQTSFPWISSVGGFHVPTCRAQAVALVLLGAAQDSGMSLPGLSERFVPPGLWLKTSRPVRSGGWMRWWPSWNGSITKRYRSLCRRRMLALGTSGEGFSLLPTLRANRWGVPDSHGRRDVWLPTLSAVSYGSNRGGAAGREGQRDRPGLDTMARRGMLPTMAARDATRGAGWDGPGRPLSEAVGGVLNPRWCEAFMGFPALWTSPELPRSPQSGTSDNEETSSDEEPSEMPLCRSVLR
jgi:hypothetical protein